ncbi:MAG: hypothetical protein PVF54_06155 [Anaerolineae bacterium]|jgi:hypothetical protein
MKTALWIGAGIVVVVALVLAGLAGGWALWGQRLWAAGPSGDSVFGRPPFADDTCGWGFERGQGMWGRGSPPALPDDCGPGEAEGDRAPAGSRPLALQDAHEAVERYVEALGYSNLEVEEVMEFEGNFYAIVQESDTGTGAMELLIDKVTGAVGPEMGPNMMWNARYGMHRSSGTMGSGNAINTIPPEEAVTIAQRWLDARRPGVSADEHADPFYGYYTIHTLEDGHIEGMLSVHGTTGQVWYHTWHGRFIRMSEAESEH